MRVRSALHLVRGAVGVVLSVVGATITGLAAARAGADVAVSVGAGAVVLAAGTTLAARLATAPFGLPRHGRILIVMSTMLGTAAIVGWAALPPLADIPRQPAPVAGVARVALATGSELAYVRLRATGGPRGVIVWVHGGPGVSDMRGDLEFLEPLVGDGFDVVVYDQVGTGRSARLSDPTQYTLERDVADLAALLDALDAPEPILVGYSYGGTVTAAYLASHPRDAAQVVFLAPGAIRPHLVDYGSGMVDRLSDEQRQDLYRLLLEPRALFRWLLTQANPRAAHQLAPDAEMDARFDRIYAATAPGLYCEPPDDIRSPTGLGFYTNAATRTIADLRPRLRSVAIPALILKPQCDYLPWAFGSDLAAALPQASLVYIEGAGHALHHERPGPVRETLRAFLRGESLPIAPPGTLDPPPDFVGPPE